MGAPSTGATAVQSATPDDPAHVTERRLRAHTERRTRPVFSENPIQCPSRSPIGIVIEPDDHRDRKPVRFRAPM